MLATFAGQPTNLQKCLKALVVTYDTTVSSATDVTLNGRTRLIEVTALSQAIFMRFASTASSSNWDHVIPAGATRYFDIDPAVVTVVSFIEQAASATLCLAEFE